MDNLSAAPWKSGRLAKSTRPAYSQIKYLKSAVIFCERVVRKALAGETIVAMCSTTSRYSKRLTTVYRKPGDSQAQSLLFPICISLSHRSRRRRSGLLLGRILGITDDLFGNEFD
jgi:hypothetical protein